jgi:predicted nucleotidyltransferase
MDVVLPAPFDRFARHRAKAEAACRAALADPDVVAMVVTGSFATGGADELSDVDLRVYVRPDAVEAVVARIPDLAAAAGRVVALFVAEHLGIPTRTIVLYDDLVHVDFDVVAADRAAEHNDGLPAVVLWEREPISDALPRNVRSGGRRRCSMVGGSDLDVVLVHPVEGSARRALRSLGRACSTCATRCCSACWRSTVNAGRRAGGGRRPSSGISVMPSRDGPTSLDPASVLAALREEIDLYRRPADPLLEQHGIERAEASTVVLRALDLGLDGAPRST